MSVLCYTYEADTHCRNCTEKRFGLECEGVDREGNEVGAMPGWDEGQLDEYGKRLPVVCGTCREIIREGAEPDEAMIEDDTDVPGQIDLFNSEVPRAGVPDFG